MQNNKYKQQAKTEMPQGSSWQFPMVIAAVFVETMEEDRRQVRSRSEKINKLSPSGGETETWAETVRDRVAVAKQRLVRRRRGSRLMSRRRDVLDRLQVEKKRSSAFGSRSDGWMMSSEGATSLDLDDSGWLEEEVGMRFESDRFLVVMGGGDSAVAACSGDEG
ncbi:hypothetical protein PIB30_068122 [Stylosanthes scabra]|uniref:Uncharacterized protein n=1 Tax=Stylosanthes scabra TaxID=79078 RepID=A0ABU6UND5_9FABA|nr:hypothetical protein [Stylosanthes scabra]